MLFQDAGSSGYRDENGPMRKLVHSGVLGYDSAQTTCHRDQKHSALLQQAHTVCTPGTHSAPLSQAHTVRCYPRHTWCTAIPGTHGALLSQVHTVRHYPRYTQCTAIPGTHSAPATPGTHSAPLTKAHTLPLRRKENTVTR